MCAPARFWCAGRTVSAISRRSSRRSRRTIRRRSRGTSAAPPFTAPRDKSWATSRLPATIAPMRDIVRHCWGLLGALLAATSVSPTCAASDQELYKGRTVQVIVGFSAGGGYGLYARVLARHLGKHLPGNPSVVPQN